MAADLIQAALLYRREPERNFPVPQGDASIGYDPANDVRVPFEGVSRRHARITFDGKEFWIQDSGSSNGTFLNGNRLRRKERLRHLDVVTLGRRVDLIFVRKAMESSRVKRHGIESASIETLDGAETGRLDEIPRGSFTIGRAPSNNVVADSQLISKIHARLERTGLQLVISDLQSANGTFVEGKRITSHVLRDGEVFNLGHGRSYRVRLNEGEVFTHDVAMAPGRDVTVAELPIDWKTRIEWTPEEKAVFDKAAAGRKSRTFAQLPAQPTRVSIAPKAPPKVAPPPIKPAAEPKRAAPPAATPAQPPVPSPLEPPPAAAKPAAAPAQPPVPSEPVSSPAAAKPAAAPAQPPVVSQPVPPAARQPEKSAAGPQVAPVPPEAVPRPAAGEPAVDRKTAVSPPLPSSAAPSAAVPQLPSLSAPAPAEAKSPVPAASAPSPSSPVAAPKAPAPAPPAKAPVAAPPATPAPPARPQPAPAAPLPGGSVVPTDEQLTRPLEPRPASIRGVILEGPDMRFTLPPGDHEIGRLPGMSVQIEGSGVSRHHSMLRVSPSEVTVEDLGSKNGTYVNNQRIVGARRLIHGDKLAIGEIKFKVSFEQGETQGR
jgi:pSer/pThr/pTyr-binding forkhead associated (FHA) protein